VDVLTSLEDRMDTAEDGEILDRAFQLHRTVFTQDDDFLTIADEWLDRGREFAGVIFAHQLAITIGQAIRDLELIAKVMETDDMRNRIEFIPY
jgi:hypothetical protein